MAILPLQLARVSNLLRTNLSLSTITRTQQSLLEVQNELSTGKRLNAPSDDPGDAAIVQQLRKTLEQRQAYADNLRQGLDQLSEVDATLGDLTQLLQQAQTLASANVGSDVTADQRQAAAAIAQSLYSQVLSLGNKQFEGVYLFGGDRATAPPFVEALGGVKFVGSERVLANAYDENTTLPFMVDSSEIFGSLSTRVQGTADLSPALSPATRLVDLKGARGEGMHLGTILLGDGTSTALVDLSHADTMGDVITAINAAGLGGIGAAVAPDGNSLLLFSGGLANITVTEVGQGTTAADLGILTKTGAGAGVPVNGQNLRPKVTLLTPLAALRGGAGIDTASGLTITNGQKTATVDLSAAVTVEDMLNAINGSGTGVLARINASGSGIDILNPVQGTSMTIAENGGTTAANLGVRSFNPQTPLAELNGGRGVQTVPGADLRITRRDGSSFDVDLSGLQTIQDVLDAINSADIANPPGGVTASFAASGNGLVLTDSTAGAGRLQVAGLNDSPAAADLGLPASASGAVLSGADVNPVSVPGIFGNLAKLRDALQRSDQPAITAAAEGLQADLDRVVRARGQTGARISELESRQDRLEDQNLATKALVSSLEDTDFTEAVSRFQTLQTALQANLQSTSRLLDLTLLDFLQ